jgi:hypothetical protein
VKSKKVDLTEVESRSLITKYWVFEEEKESWRDVDERTQNFSRTGE